MHTRRFRPSAYYGDAGGAGARSEASDWTVLHGNELWVDDSGYVFLVFPTTGPTDPRLQVLYRPDGSVPSKVYFANDPALPGIVSTLRTRGHKATTAEIEAYKAKGQRRTSAPTTAIASAPTFSLPTPDAPGAAPKKKGKKRRVRVDSGAFSLVKQTWFPFAVGGVALLVVAIIAVAVKARRSQGAA